MSRRFHKDEKGAADMKETDLVRGKASCQDDWEHGSEEVLGWY